MGGRSVWGVKVGRTPKPSTLVPGLEGRPALLLLASLSSKYGGWERSPGSTCRWRGCSWLSHTAPDGHTKAGLQDRGGKASLLQNASTAPLGRNNDAKSPEITNINTQCTCLAGISGLECVCVLTAVWVRLLGEKKWPGPLFLAGQQGCSPALWCCCHVGWIEWTKTEDYWFQKEAKRIHCSVCQSVQSGQLHQNHLEVLFKNTHSFILSLNKQILISCVWQA